MVDPDLKGKELEIAVTKVFKANGFDALHVGRWRPDLLVRRGEKLVLGEVKAMTTKTNSISFRPTQFRFIDKLQKFLDAEYIVVTNIHGELRVLNSRYLDELKQSKKNVSQHIDVIIPNSIPLSKFLESWHVEAEKILIRKKKGEKTA